ncbi:hypothetical protein L211DRAFT_848734 [Terfezia boudieri ATCC MYA-4762]|uniref:Uncharacterized protein n=1 Tax=Terfezia boudieri ATCC MYA-4762 TaxID=1051890 RepID=A0A3N4LNJ1_9PEZI|nr:hypothetical protein L211DRAFT_848734 [Terfezia boudieri ATCC MYA-4762]
MPGVPPQALDMLKKFGRSLFRSKSRKRQRKTEEQNHTQTEPEAESSGPPAPYGVPAPPPPAPIVSETAPQIEAPKPGTHILLQRDHSTGFANFSIDISEAPAVLKEEVVPSPAPVAQVTTPEPARTLVAEPTPSPEAPKAEEVPKVEEAPKLPELIVEAPKVEAEDTPAPAPGPAPVASPAATA